MLRFREMMAAWQKFPPQFSRHLNPSVQCRRLLFLSSFPPPFRPVNRLSIRLLPRFSVTLENSNCLKLTFSPWGSRSQFQSASTMNSGLMLAEIRISEGSSVTRPDYCYLFLPKPVHFILIGRTARPVPCLISSSATTPWPWTAMVWWRGWGGARKQEKIIATGAI